MKQYFNELLEQLRKKRYTKKQVAALKRKLCQKYKVQRIPTDIEILLHAEPEDIKKLKYLQTKPTRSISGVAPVAIMTKPYKCPHAGKGGPCIMCPGGPSSFFGDMPQSYTGEEPATMRGLRAGFDPYIQVFNRLEQFIVTGHFPDKVELIIMGGTFPSTPKKYQEEFVKYALKAMNDFSKLFFTNKNKNDIDFLKFKQFFELPGKVGNPTRTKNIHSKLKKLKTRDKQNKTVKTRLETEQKRNESSTIRCVGMTIETRPDHGMLEHGKQMLKLGATRVELGIQSVYEKALEKMHRGHTVKDSIKSIRTLKDLGFKLNFHYMPGLPGITRKQDFNGMRSLFSNPDFCPDMLKIYPCMVMPGTKLEKMHKKGKFEALSTEDAAEMIAEFKRYVKPYCRIMRVQRDIPSGRVIAGVKKTNLRQYIDKVCKERKINCQCIRCREVGRQKSTGKVDIKVMEYEASCGEEYFISAESSKSLIGFCRLRFPFQSLRKEITKDSALIRELHVFGEAVAIGAKGKASQHKGWGKKLLKKAEQIAKKNGKKKIVVISGIGVRPYYRKLGYKKQGPYMVKNI